jgi:hypothetical protein
MQAVLGRSATALRHKPCSITLLKPHEKIDFGTKWNFGQIDQTVCRKYATLT